MSALSFTRADLLSEARDILRRNDRGGYTVPNERVYPFQWNWDSAFVAMGFVTFDADRGWRELETLFSGQWPDGMVPHILFHAPADGYYPGPAAWDVPDGRKTSGITQPPVAASAALMLFHRDPDRDRAAQRAAALLPALDRNHEWWSTARDPHTTGLVTIVHPWETGRDNLPDWDAPLRNVTPRVDVSALRKDIRHVDAAERPSHDFYNRVMTLVEEAKALHWSQRDMALGMSFRICDLGTQCILTRAERDLATLAGLLGDNAIATAARARAARLTSGFSRLAAPDGTWHSRDLRNDAVLPFRTSATFLPLYAGIADGGQADHLAALYRRWKAVTRYGIPSTDPTVPEFEPRRYWRGPVWLVMNFMAMQGFRDYGYGDIARQIAADSLALVERGGFAESFDPVTGQGTGGTEFSWTAAMVLLALEDGAA